MITVGLGLLGAVAGAAALPTSTAPIVLEGFGFGGALLAMFMRVGGGIFTKAADVGADLVGKVEAGIPEDDPRNAATIADNVGDNVGDCAGMAADLFESYAVTLVAALILGQVFFGAVGMVFPLLVAGDRRHRLGRRHPGQQPAATTEPAAWRRSTAASSPPRPSRWCSSRRRRSPTCRASSDGSTLSVSPQVLGFVSVLIGIVLAAAIQQLTGYFTETSRSRCKDVGRSSLTGPATVILSGISLGLESAVYAALLIGGAVYGAFLIGGGGRAVRGRAGRLRPADHRRRHRLDGHLRPGQRQRAGHRRDVRRHRRGGRAGAHRPRRRRQHHQGDHQGHRDRDRRARRDRAVRLLQRPDRRRRCDKAGAHASATRSASVDHRTTSSARSSARRSCSSSPGLAISAVSRAAGRVVFEVREQFRTQPGIMDYTERPDYARVVDICTKDSLRELATPGLLAVLAPVAVGFGLGIGPLAAYLVGAIAAGTLMAVFLANSGGAWDNAKKMVEDGAYGGKGSEAHAATVIGDTVGDPFKDTAGPAINPLIKVMNLVALLIAPAVVSLSVGDDANTARPRVLIASSRCWSSWPRSSSPSAGRSSSAARRATPPDTLTTSAP